MSEDTSTQQTIDFSKASWKAPKDPIPQLIADELLFLRREIKEMKRDIFDNSEMLARMSDAVIRWVGVEEE